MFTGRCVCGGVRFEIDAPLGPVVYCHCSICRRATGSAFASNAAVRTNGFRIVAGEELIASYKASPGYFRCFCSRCGSPLFGRPKDPAGPVRVRLGSISEDPGVRAIAHIWTESKGCWFEITDDLKQFAENPPEEYFRVG